MYLWSKSKNWRVWVLQSNVHHNINPKPNPRSGYVTTCLCTTIKCGPQSVVKQICQKSVLFHTVIEVYEISKFLLHTTNFNANMNSMFKFYRREINYLFPVRNSCHCKFLYMIFCSSFLSWCHCIKHFEVWSSMIYTKIVHATKTCWKNKTVHVLLCW